MELALNDSTTPTTVLASGSEDDETSQETPWSRGGSGDAILKTTLPVLVSPDISIT